MGVGAINGVWGEQVWGWGKIKSLVLNMLSLRCRVCSVGMQVWSSEKVGWEYKFGIRPCRIDEIILGVLQIEECAWDPRHPRISRADDRCSRLCFV